MEDECFFNSINFSDLKHAARASDSHSLHHTYTVVQYVQRTYVCTVHCTVYVQYVCTMYSTLCTVLYGVPVYSVQCTLYSVQCTLYSVQCTLYTVHCTLYSTYVPTVHCVLYCTQCTYCTEHCEQYTVYCVRYLSSKPFDPSNFT